MNGAKELAQKKIGPLPVWVIGAVIGGALAFKLLRGGGASRATGNPLTSVSQPGGGFPNPTAPAPPSAPPASEKPITFPSDDISNRPIIDDPRSLYPHDPVAPVVTQPSSVSAPITEAAPFLSGPIYVKQQTEESGNIPAGAVVATGGLPFQEHPISLSPWYQKQLGLNRVGSTVTTNQPGVKIVE